MAMDRWARRMGRRRGGGIAGVRVGSRHVLRVGGGKYLRPQIKQ